MLDCHQQPTKSTWCSSRQGQNRVCSPGCPLTWEAAPVSLWRGSCWSLGLWKLHPGLASSGGRVVGGVTPKAAVHNLTVIINAPKSPPKPLAPLRPLLCRCWCSTEGWQQAPWHPEPLSFVVTREQLMGYKGPAPDQTPPTQAQHTIENHFEVASL